MNRKVWNLSSVCVIVWRGRNKKRRMKQKSEKDEWSFPRRKKRIDGNGGNEYGEPRPTFTKFSIESVDQPVEIYRSIDRPRDNLLSTNGFDVPLCEIIERVKRIESMDGLIVICIRFYNSSWWIRAMLIFFFSHRAWIDDEAKNWSSRRNF